MKLMISEREKRAQRLRQFMLYWQLNNDALARKLGVTRQTVWRWVSCKTDIPSYVFDSFSVVKIVSVKK